MHIKSVAATTKVQHMKESPIHRHMFDKFKVSALERVLCIMECTRMSQDARLAYDGVLGTTPVEICARHFSPVTRPRWWWIWPSPTWPSDTSFEPSLKDSEVPELIPQVVRESLHAVLELGWEPVASSAKAATFGLQRCTQRLFVVRCLTRVVFKTAPISAHRSIDRCDSVALAKWREVGWAQAPYQYQASDMVIDRRTAS